jgi:hypothetical protein
VAGRGVSSLNSRRRTWVGSEAKYTADPWPEEATTRRAFPPPGEVTTAQYGGLDLHSLSLPYFSSPTPVSTDSVLSLFASQLDSFWSWDESGAAR